MGIAFDPSRPSSDQVSKLYTARFATSEEKAAMEAEGTAAQDKIEISQEGQDAVSAAPGEINFDAMAEKVNAWVDGMTKDDFMALMREQLGEPKQLEINWVAVVDPDHMIWTKTYAESMLSQLKEVEGVIENYYADAYQEALRDPNPLMFLAAKYKCSWSDYFNASLPANERQWLYDQVRRMLLGQQVSLADPYALAGTGLNQGNSVDEIARKAATDKIEELIRQAKEAAGVEDKQ